MLSRSGRMNQPISLSPQILSIDMRKLRGGSISPLTELKGLLQSNDDALKDVWAWSKEVITSATIRGRILSRFGIQLSCDGQVTQLWAWLSALVNERNGFERMAGIDRELFEYGLPLLLDSRRRRVRWVLTG